MTTPPYTTPECRMDVHQYCHGNLHTFAAYARPGDAPTETLHCACPCHAAPKGCRPEPAASPAEADR